MTDDKLIIEFIGRVGKNNKNLYTFPGLHDITGDTWIKLEDMKFSTSWDWLMVVIRKISEVASGGVTYDVQNSLFEADIEKTFDLVVEFIKWYNINKL